MRLDIYLTNNGVESRNKASALIADGLVTVDGRVVKKPAFNVTDGMSVSITQAQRYVARSAVKLITAFQRFGLDVKGKTAADFGASTGGFCQVLLEKGAKRVYAVDVGIDQLHPSVSADPRVTVMDNTNVRYLSAKDFPEKIDFITCDLSFISLKLILGAVKDTLAEQGSFICLVKPQFEVGAANVDRHGVVKDGKLHVHAISDVAGRASALGFDVLDLCFSGLAGESGNREYLLYMKLTGGGKTLLPAYIENCVSEVRQ